MPVLWLNWVAINIDDGFDSNTSQKQMERQYLFGANARGNECPFPGIGWLHE